MGVIYKQAAQAIVWLGPAYDNSNHALAAFRNFAEKADELERNPRGLDIEAESNKSRSKTSWLKKLVRSNKKEGLSPALSETAYDGMHEEASEVLSRDWFERVWVVQEVSLAKSATVLCGWARMDWISLRKGVEYGYTTGKIDDRVLGVAVAPAFSTLR